MGGPLARTASVVCRHSRGKLCAVSQRAREACTHTVECERASQKQRGRRYTEPCRLRDSKSVAEPEVRRRGLAPCARSHRRCQGQSAVLPVGCRAAIDGGQLGSLLTQKIDCDCDGMVCPLVLQLPG